MRDQPRRAEKHSGHDCQRRHIGQGELINVAFLDAVISAGVTCPIVDASKVRPAILAIDLVLGRDNYAQRYIRAFRQRQAPK